MIVKISRRTSTGEWREQGVLDPFWLQEVESVLKQDLRFATSWRW
jgi:hypothetical protein